MQSLQKNDGGERQLQKNKDVPFLGYQQLVRGLNTNINEYIRSEYVKNYRK